MQEFIPTFENINNASKPGAFAFFNKSKGLAWVGYGNSILEAIGRNIRQILNGSHTSKELIKNWNSIDWIILWLPNSTEPMVQQSRKLYELLVSDGITILSRVPAIWIINIRPVFIFHRLSCVVEARKHYNKKIEPLAIFHKMEEATEWVNKHYPIGVCHGQLIYKESDLLNRYRKVIENKEEWFQQPIQT